MEKTHACEAHHDAVFVATADDVFVADRAARLRHVRNAAFISPLNIVVEGEECVRSEGNAADRGKIGGNIAFRERVGAGDEIFLPGAFGADVFLVAIDVSVDNVIARGSSYIASERQRKHFIALP